MAAVVGQRALASTCRHRLLKLLTSIFLVIWPLVPAMARESEVGVTTTAAPNGFKLPERIVVFGDSQAQGLAVALSGLLRGNTGYMVFNRGKPNTGLSQVST